MTELSKRDIEHIFEKLRNGLVPERAVEAFAVGIEKRRDELKRQLDLVSSKKGNEGNTKFLRGAYGCGKTFTARLAIHDAQKRGFATSFVVVSDNDLRFHQFDEVYRKVMNELSTESCERGALGDILDRWIGEVEDGLIDGGEDDSAPDFDEKVRKRIDADLTAATGGKIPQDFIRVVQTIFDLKQKGETAEAGALISWLSGSPNVAASAKRAADIKGDIGSRAALDYLRGVLEIVKAAGYAGLVIVIDEAETILRMPRKDSRHKSLNGIRQIADAAGSFPGMLWVFTGTPEFFDSKRGVEGLPPLADRLRFQKSGAFASLRQPQLELKQFDAQRLKEVALKLRELFPTKDRRRLEAKVSDEFIGMLVDQVTQGFKGHVGVVPRTFLREFLNQMDLVEQEGDEYDPAAQYSFAARELTPEEKAAMEGRGPTDPATDEDDDFIPAAEVF